MGMTMTQKILAKHAGLDSVVAGQLIEANLDLVLGNDVTAPVAIKEMEKMDVDCVFCKDKIALVPDHFTPNKDIKSAEQCKVARTFARGKEVVNYFDVGQMGIEHCLLPEKGLVTAWYWTYLGIIEAGRYAPHKNPIAAEKMAVTEDNTETLFTKEQIKCTKSVALIVERSITPMIVILLKML